MNSLHLASRTIKSYLHINNPHLVSIIIKLCLNINITETGRILNMTLRCMFINIDQGQERTFDRALDWKY